MFKSYKFSYYDTNGGPPYDVYYWMVVDDDFTARITNKDCDNILDAVILAYERNSAPVAPGVVKFLLKTYNQYDVSESLANCAQHSSLYKRYEKDIDRYMVLV